MILSIVVAALAGASFLIRTNSMQIYGIDLGKNKFDVSFLSADKNSNMTRPMHKVVKNTAAAIGNFLKKLPEDALLVAEHTGAYGDLLLKMCTENGVHVSYVSGLVIHTYRSTLDREKSDELDCASLREFGMRFADKLAPTSFPEKDIYELRQLRLLRSQLVEQRKALSSLEKSESVRPIRSDVAKDVLQQTLVNLNKQIKRIEDEMQVLIKKNQAMAKNYDIVTSVIGVGLVTAVDLLVNTQNFTTIKTARAYASYAGIAPCKNESGTINKGTHISKYGCRQAKSLLYTCALSACTHNKEYSLYFQRRTQNEGKNRFYVMNAIANKLLRTIFALIAKGETYDPTYICRAPRKAS